MKEKNIMELLGFRDRIDIWLYVHAPLLWRIKNWYWEKWDE